MRILLATDGSEGATAAARLVASLPLELDSQLEVVTVIEPGREDEADRALASARAALRFSPASLITEVRRGHPAEEIVEAAEGHRADLVVVGSRGRSAIARFFLGSVAERVVRHAPCPALLARPHREQLRRVLIALDGSAPSALAARWIRDFPLPPECDFSLVTVLPLMHTIGPMAMPITPPLADHVTTLGQWQREQAEERLASEAAAFAAAGKHAVTELRSGDPALSLVQAAEEQRADLIVVGSHGWSGIDRFLLGSVSEDVLRHAPCSVLVVKGSRD